MPRKEYNKLVRDNIPDIIVKNGGLPHTRVLHTEEFVTALRAKLLEEAHELVAATSHEEALEELADVLEVVDTLRTVYAVDADRLAGLQQAKRAKRGGFTGRIYLEYVDEKSV